ncbi:hypothetical protein RHD99_05335 [Buttiauxella selenatireducens]|uniref:Uncharacterized protein n=1 Tax=Buttiauxella selenatireducens TaxID=3073902 RepID=A0ABY9SEI7_9ENTR|nr:hypothetical protein [Buttiauxella sp. R73]WMY75383.1 hypothetical protein RHD99_05335 [Buttiauxella sp. R73]
MKLTPEQLNAVRSQTKICARALKDALKKAQENRLDIIRDVITDHHRKLEPMGISRTLFKWHIGVVNKVFKEKE